MNNGAVVLGLAAALGAGLIIWQKTRGEVTPPPGWRAAPPDGRGDINMDGWVSPEDLEYIKDYMMGQYTPTAEQLRRMDVNCDGKIDSGDMLALQKYITLGTLPAC